MSIPSIPKLTADKSQQPIGKSYSPVSMVVVIGAIAIAFVAGFVFGFMSSSNGRKVNDVGAIKSASDEIASARKNLEESQKESDGLGRKYRELVTQNSRLNGQVVELREKLADSVNKVAELRHDRKTTAVPPTHDATAPNKNTQSDSEATALALIKRNAEKEWPNDYEMQNYQRDNQLEAFRELTKLASVENVPNSVFDKIKSIAKSDWPEDFEMQLYTIKNQIDAYLKR